MGRSRSHKELKKIVWAKTGGICAHCGKPAHGKTATIEHFVPKTIGGSIDQRNLVPLCKDCNKRRMSRDIDPLEYYRFAPQKVIDDCLTYEKEFMSNRVNIAGEIIGIVRE